MLCCQGLAKAGVVGSSGINPGSSCYFETRFRQPYRTRDRKIRQLLIRLNDVYFVDYQPEAIFHFH